MLINKKYAVLKSIPDSLYVVQCVGNYAHVLVFSENDKDLTWNISFNHHYLFN